MKLIYSQGTVITSQGEPLFVHVTSYPHPVLTPTLLTLLNSLSSARLSSIQAWYHRHNRSPSNDHRAGWTELRILCISQPSGAEGW